MNETIFDRDDHEGGHGAVINASWSSLSIAELMDEWVRIFRDEFLPASLLPDTPAFLEISDRLTELNEQIVAAEARGRGE